MSHPRTSSLKPQTLSARRRYYGLDARHLRDASGRVVSRVVGLPPERARHPVAREVDGHGFTIERLRLEDGERVQILLARRR